MYRVPAFLQDLKKKIGYLRVELKFKLAVKHSSLRVWFQSLSDFPPSSESSLYRHIPIFTFHFLSLASQFLDVTCFVPLTSPSPYTVDGRIKSMRAGDKDQEITGYTSFALSLQSCVSALYFNGISMAFMFCQSVEM